MLKAILLLGVAAQALALPTLSASNSTISSSATPYVVPQSEPTSTAVEPISASTTHATSSPSLLAKAQDVAEGLASSLLDEVDEDEIAELIAQLAQGAHSRPVEKRGLGSFFAGIIKALSEVVPGAAARKAQNNMK